MLFLIRSYYSTSFFTLNGFNPFLITRGIPITAFLHCYKISRSSSSYRIVYINFSHLSCLLYSIIRSTCAFVLHLHFCIVFSSRNSSIIFFFFLDRVDASNFILYRMNLENTGKNFFHCSNFIRNKFYQESVKRKFKLNIFRLREKRNATTLCCNRHTISDSVI